MKNSSINFVRRIAVILLVAAVVASTIVAAMAIVPEVKYLASKSLAYDAPIYGSTDADLQVIKAEHRNETWGTMGITFALLQCISVWLVAILLGKRLANNNTKNLVRTPRGFDTSWKEAAHAAETTEFVRDLKKALADYEWSGV